MEDTLRSPLAPRPISAPLALGSDFGHYRIISLLGEGGMGQVFRVEHRDLGRPAALKILRPELVDSPEAVRRFLLEARLVAAIKHPHVVEIFDFGREPNGLTYYVMELLEGSNLQDTRDHQGPFSLQAIREVVRQSCEALAAVHAQRVVHRDLKPENILLIKRPGNPDLVKVVDFGVARPPRSGSPFEPGPGRTAVGTIVGTPEFMSPEQASGKEVDLRCDLYSLGVVLYWMLSDRLPFEGESFFEVAAKRESGPPPPLPAASAAGEEIPSGLRELTERLLERRPDRRPQTATEVIELLGRPECAPAFAVQPSAAVQGIATPSAPPLRRLPLNRAWLLAGAAAVVVGLWTASVVQGHRSQEVDPIVVPDPELPALPSAIGPGPEVGPPPVLPTPAPAPPPRPVPPQASAPAVRSPAAPKPKPAPRKPVAKSRGPTAGPSALRKDVDLVNPYGG